VPGPGQWPDITEAIHSIVPCFHFHTLLPISAGDYNIGLFEQRQAGAGVHSMAWIWMLTVAGAVLLWALSLGRILSSPAPSSLALSPHFLPPLRGDRRSRNVLLVVAHPDDESMYENEALPLHLPLSLSLSVHIPFLYVEFAIAKVN
jgi:hypothetical protein